MLEAIRFYAVGLVTFLSVIVLEAARFVRTSDGKVKKSILDSQRIEDILAYIIPFKSQYTHMMGR